jgi:hypothetical protein
MLGSVSGLLTELDAKWAGRMAVGMAAWLVAAMAVGMAAVMAVA